MSRKKYILTPLILLLLAILAFGGSRLFRYTRSLNSQEAVWLKIPRGCTPEQLQDSLSAAFGQSLAKSVSSLLDDDAAGRNGAYRFEPGTRAYRIARTINRGMQTPVRFTFNNVRTLDRLADLASARLDFSSREFIDSCKSAARAQGISLEELSTHFLPDTYDVYWNITPAGLIDKLDQNYNRFWTEERSARARSLGLTPFQISILASIAEEESNNRAERPVIARLYLNRLNRGMLLQADPTVKFATGDFAARRITADMLKSPSPYNTYKAKGLPPGPIRLPEAATIDAILNSSPHKYIYMCAKTDGSGTHSFTSDYATHLANARAFRKAAYGK